MCTTYLHITNVFMWMYGRPFAEKMRAELFEMDDTGHLVLKQNIDRPAFLRYNSPRVLDQFGALQWIVVCCNVLCCSVLILRQNIDRPAILGYNCNRVLDTFGSIWGEAVCCSGLQCVAICCNV